MKSSHRSEMVLDVNDLEPWEIAARLHMLLVEPRASEKRMGDLIARACSEQIAVSIKSHPERRAELLARYPAYRPNASRTQSKNEKNKFEDAHRLGVAVLVMIKETATGELPIIDGIAQRPSMAFLARSMWPRTTWEPDDQYEDRLLMAQRRKIRDVFSIAHLAAALQRIARETEHAGKPMTFDYQDLGFHRRWVELANELAGHIRATPALKNLAPRLINLRWVEKEQISAPPLPA